MIKSSQVTAFHQHCLAQPDWPEQEAALPAGEHKVWEWILANLRYNAPARASRHVQRGSGPAARGARQ